MLVHNELKSRDLVSDLHVNVSELKNIFHENYNIKDAVVGRLEFSNVTK